MNALTRPKLVSTSATSLSKPAKAKTGTRKTHQPPAELDGRVLRIQSAEVRTQTECVAALSGVIEALAEQREAIRVFRETMAEVKQATDDLMETTKDFQRSLDRIDMKPLRSKSLRLARIADEWANPLDHAA